MDAPFRGDIAIWTTNERAIARLRADGPEGPIIVMASAPLEPLRRQLAEALAKVGAQVGSDDPGYKGAVEKIGRCKALKRLQLLAPQLFEEEGLARQLAREELRSREGFERSAVSLLRRARGGQSDGGGDSGERLLGEMGAAGVKATAHAKRKRRRSHRLRPTHPSKLTRARRVRLRALALKRQRQRQQRRRLRQLRLGMRDRQTAALPPAASASLPSHASAMAPGGGAARPSGGPAIRSTSSRASVAPWSDDELREVGDDDGPGDGAEEDVSEDKTESASPDEHDGEGDDDTGDDGTDDTPDGDDTSDGDDEGEDSADDEESADDDEPSVSGNAEGLDVGISADPTAEGARVPVGRIHPIQRGRRRLRAALLLLARAEHDPQGAAHLRSLIRLARSGSPAALEAIGVLRTAQRLRRARGLAAIRREGPSTRLAGASPALGPLPTGQRPWWHYLNPLLALKERS